MRKKALLSLILVLVFSLPTGITLADDCEHKWGEYYQHPIYNLCHAQTCTKCKTEVRFGNHVGKDICGAQTCSVCSIEWTNGHNWDWDNAVANNDATCYDVGSKTVYCSRKGCQEYMELANHEDKKKDHCYENYVNDNNASCTKNGTETSKCKWFGDYCHQTDTREVEGSMLGHSFSNYVSDNNATCLTDGTKTATCDRDGCDETSSERDVGSAKGHTPGAEATCATAQTCTVCGEELVSAKGHTPGAEATCTAAQTCIVCGEELASAKGHTPGAEATCTAAQTCTVCGEVLDVAKGHTPGAEATCTAAQTCTVCGEVLKPVVGHSYVAEVTQSTCEQKGYTTYTCKICGDGYKDDYTAARSHWYGLWSDNGNGTHSANCNRCEYMLTVVCVMGCEVTLTAATENAEAIVWSVCPVCGKMNELQLLAYEMPGVRVLDKNAIPNRGELIVRGLEAPFDGVLYALTAVYEYAGKVEPLAGPVAITIPVELETMFKVVYVDVTPATEKTERVETWKEIPYSYENGELTFETGNGGLFLLIPAE